VEPAEKLLGELKAIRRAGQVLTSAQLRGSPTLLDYLGGRPREALARFAKLVDLIEDKDQRVAVKYVFGFIGKRGDKLESRRSEAKLELSASQSTIERRENAGLAELANLIAEYAARDRGRERQEPKDSNEKRIEDLEAVVSLLGRTLGLPLIQEWYDTGYTEFVKDSLDDGEKYDGLAHLLDVIGRATPGGQRAITAIDEQEKYEAEMLNGTKKFIREHFRLLRPPEEGGLGDTDSDPGISG